MAKNNIRIKDSLMKKISQYDSQAFEELYNQASSAVYAYAFSLLHNKFDAEEVMQETFVSIYNNISTYNFQGKAMAWIITITRNNALMKLRDHKKRQYRDLDESFDLSTTQNVEKIVEHKIDISKGLEVLNEVESEIVILHVVANLKHREIAEIYDMPLSSVLSKYKRSLSKLRKRMEENGYERT